jgi:predicted nucleic acid-binding protein
MPDSVFFDTNVLIYALAKDDPRTARAQELLDAGGLISVQILNEFASVARRKMLFSWREVEEALTAIRDLCPDPLPITIEIHQQAVYVAQKYEYGVYDALVIAAAMSAHCTVLYSEDFPGGQMIERVLRIRNPFA